jgi:hypothetical protein
LGILKILLNQKIALKTSFSITFHLKRA